MAHIKFSTDSASDIPAALREEWNIQVLPFPIAMGDREYMDGFDFTPDEFFQMLLDSPQIPTHAQLNPYLFTECFEKAWKEGYTDLIHTSINSKGSATYGNAIQARDEFYEDHPDAQDTFHTISSTPKTTPWATAGRWCRGPRWLLPVPRRERSWILSRIGGSCPG